MGSLTDELPKPMLPVNGKPLIAHVVERLRAAGIERVLIVTGYLAEMIEQHFAGSEFPIEFIRQNEPNGTATAALLAREFAGSDAFLLTFGDILADPADYAALVGMMSDAGTDGVVGVKSVADPFQGAAVYAEGGRISNIVEKPPPGTSQTNWNSAGVFALRPTAFDFLERVPLSPRGEYELTSALGDMLLNGKKLLLYELKGGWRDVGRPTDLETAETLTGRPQQY